MSENRTITVITPPGLEALTTAEMTALGIPPRPAPRVPEAGVLEVEGGLAEIARLNLHLRTASRVVVRLGDFNAAAFSELRKKASRLAWAAYLTPGQPVTVRVTTHGSRLYHKKGIAERVAGAIGDALGAVPAVVAATDEDAAGAPLILVRIAHNHCTVSIDSSGAHLHRRGYRLAVAKAPLRENLAAALVLASGWRPGRPLLDPCCGAGTIVIEAAMMAAGIPPGWSRSFAFAQWPSFDAAVWAAERAAVAAPALTGGVVAWGGDRDAGAIEAAQANALRAGVAARVAWARRSVSDTEFPGSEGVVITNPPYGERVKGGPDLRNFYARLGAVIRGGGPGWSGLVLTSSPRWSGQLGGVVAPVVRFLNGGLPVTAYRVESGEEKEIPL
jgi:putative N6-adenine-specific DNA methylase